jgi:hypothetical protein
VVVLLLALEVLAVLVVTAEGQEYLLDLLLRTGSVAGKDFILGLYKNNVTIARNTVLASLQQATFPGYAPVTLTRSQWQAPQAVSIYEQSYWGTAFTLFTCTGGTQLVYGSYVRDSLSNVLLWGEKFSDPITAVLDVAIPVFPAIRLRSEF